MKTITEAAKITGIIPQRINDYEKAGLLDKPSARNKYQYRLYSDKEIVRLWQIRFYKELGFTVPQMKRVFGDPAYRPEIGLAEQIRLLEEKVKKIEALLLQAKALQRTGLEPAAAYESVPGVDRFTYDEAAEITFPVWSRALLAAAEDAEAEAGEMDPDDGFFRDLDGVMELFESGCEPADPDVQARLRAVKQRHGIPIASLLLMLEMRELRDGLPEAYGHARFRQFRDAVRIAAKAEAADMQAQAQICIGRLIRMSSLPPEEEQVQQELARFLRSVSYGGSFPEDPGDPKDYELEALEELIRQYADRDSAFYAFEYRTHLARAERAARSGQASREAQAEAAACADRLHAQAAETLVPALRVYLKTMTESKAARRTAADPDGNP